MADDIKTAVTIPLGQLPRGQKAIVAALLETDENLDTALRELGFAEGLDVSVLHESPFGRDPIAIGIGPMTVALRRKEANIVMVTPV
ncbi:iron transporter FeoA [Kordiimonas sediminis]|uniref:Iron transporter FeoA n=1 Tax=Kordiimonas sediminis TaxID=1735581 RepID=A0A919EAI7_9PROT|nr:FeoA family protein [Kordiimonas sediminis]GHF30342.1 iron transporter FeoA [Kordiimonas sediminis]